MSPKKIKLNGDNMKTNENIDVKDVNVEQINESNGLPEHRTIKVKTSNEDSFVFG